jgi:hypothetical protein
MTDLILKRADRRDEEYYDILADGEVVGRIKFFAATPGALPFFRNLPPFSGLFRRVPFFRRVPSSVSALGTRGPW